MTELLGKSMVSIKAYDNQLGNTLIVWFSNPEDEFEAEETSNEVVLMKDKQGGVIGFEKLTFAPAQESPLPVAFETVAA